jgi:hypothetical protein
VIRAAKLFLIMTTVFHGPMFSHGVAASTIEGVEATFTTPVESLTWYPNPAYRTAITIGAYDGRYYYRVVGSLYPPANGTVDLGPVQPGAQTLSIDRECCEILGVITYEVYYPGGHMYIPFGDTETFTSGIPTLNPNAGPIPSSDSSFVMVGPFVNPEWILASPLFTPIPPAAWSEKVIRGT